jgi:uncharacterized protein YdeI (BOF family)
MSVPRVMTYVATFGAGALAFAAVGFFQAPFNAQATAEPNSVATAAVESAPSQASATQSRAGVDEIGSLQRNARVVIEGVVTRATEEDEFVLEDSTGSIQVYTGTTFFVANVGETVRVVGFVDESVFLEVYAQEVIHSDGRVTTISY